MMNGEDSFKVRDHFSAFVEDSFKVRDHFSAFVFRKSHNLLTLNFDFSRF